MADTGGYVSTVGVGVGAATGAGVGAREGAGEGAGVGAGSFVCAEGVGAGTVASVSDAAGIQGRRCLRVIFTGCERMVTARVPQGT